MAPGQETKTIAYALLSNEKKESREFIFQTIKREVELIVNGQIKAGVNCKYV